MDSIEVENNIALTVTVCIASFEVIGELQRERLRHSRAATRRAEYLRRSLVIVCRERGQWQASFMREKSACLAGVSVTEQILREFPEILGKLSMRKQCVPGSVLPAHARAWERPTLKPQPQKKVSSVRADYVSGFRFRYCIFEF